MGTKITTLVENTVTAGLVPLLGEHGLSFLVECDGKPILFDAGQGLALPGNARSLGVDLKSIDTVVLSHGHYDHAKGLKPLAEINGGFRVIGHDAIFEEKLACLGTDCFPIGIGSTRAELDQLGIDFQLSKEPVEIAPGVMTTGEIPFTSFETVEPMFFKEAAGGRLPDDLPDDNALILDTAQGTVVVLGCAHRGVVNTLHHVAALTGKKKIHAILGGLHLFLADPARLDKVCEALAPFEIDRMIVGHCTGFAAIAALYQKFGNKVTPNSVGISVGF